MLNDMNRYRTFVQAAKCVLLCFIATSLFAPIMAVAQEAGGAPQPNLSRAPSPLVGFGLMFLMVVVVIGISFIPSKRGHLD
jgi:hypothetical protein